MRHSLAPGLVFVLFALPLAGSAAPPLEYFLPEAAEHDPAVPPPAAALGFELGEWHARHDQIVDYLRRLETASERVRLFEYGRTHELRPLTLAIITSVVNHERLEALRDAHLRRAFGEAASVEASDEEPPVVVYLGYSVHGNESSGANASLAVAYHLAAARGETMDRWLDRAIILLDPCINPDGFSRFAAWANMHRGRTLVADPLHREHVEPWPNGRTNHYWFDLNRDWLLLTQPESRARIEVFHRWLPNVVGDFHEMGTDATFFFQPGVPSRQNPLVPARGLELTRELALFHARALDRLGSLYFTEETFDDFYFGKGSTYPDAHGAVGILFEQASSRGHLQDSENGPLEFPFTIRNQAATSFSTIEGAVARRQELLEYQREFHRGALENARASSVRAWVFGDPRDPSRTYAMVDLLRMHRIEVHELARPIAVAGKSFEPGAAYVVPAVQRQYTLVRTLFDRVTEFADETFYDVSTWTVPLAFDLPCTEVKEEEDLSSLLGDPATDGPRGSAARSGEADDPPYAWAFDSSRYWAPRTALRLLQAGVRLRAASRPFRASTTVGSRRFEHGAIVVPSGGQDVAPERLRELVAEAAARDELEIHALPTGLTAEGIDLGSPSFVSLRPPRVALVVGSGVSAYSAGEAWHLLDERFEIPVTLVPLDELQGTGGARALTRHTHLVFVDGAYGSVDGEFVDRLRLWIREGGVLVAHRGAVDFVDARVLERPARAASPPAPAPTDAGDAKFESLPYGEYEARRSAKLVSGAILETIVDTTHPIAWGYTRDRLAVFRRGTAVSPLDRDPFATPLRYTDAPLLSGYASEENQRRIAGTAAVTCHRVGRGTVVRFMDDTNFRSYWRGTNRLLLNAVLYGHVIRATGP